MPATRQSPDRSARGAAKQRSSSAGKQKAVRKRTWTKQVRWTIERVSCTCLAYVLQRRLRFKPKKKKKDAEKYFEIVNQNLQQSQESVELNAEVAELTALSRREEEEVGEGEYSFEVSRSPRSILML